MEEPFNKTFHFFALNSVPDSDGEYHLFTCSFPQFIFYNGLSDNEVVEWQNKINTTPKILVVGDSTTVSASDISSKKTIIGNAYKKQNGNYNNLPPFIRFGAPNWDYENFTDFIDKNINTQHSITGYIDAYKRIRVFYMDSNGNIASKVSDNYGDTWRADLAI
jgi:hypothetical protein